MKDKAIAQTTPFPNWLLDGAMAELRDTEWRVLCVVIRQPLGWVDSATGKRKHWDWLSHTFLKRRTGRQSQAISQAIDQLAKQGFIMIEVQAGRALDSRTLPRRHRGRLYIHLGPRFYR